MRRRCDVNRSLVLGFDCVPSFLAESPQQTGEGSVKVERSEPKGNLDGFLARLHHSPQNEGKGPVGSQGPTVIWSRLRKEDSLTFDLAK
jgi:hypothetical protein